MLHEQSFFYWKAKTLLEICYSFVLGTWGTHLMKNG
jgi:hypothetical protein